MLALDKQASNLGGPGCAVRVYLPYGFLRDREGALLCFAAQPLDLLTGCYHLGNGYRAYNPVLMRFHAQDSHSPFGKGGLNAYAYCGGDPVNRHDPTGKVSEWATLSLRGLSMASNTVTLTYNFLGPTPTNRVGLNASRISTFGSVLSLASSGAQFAGVESAIFGANVGLGVSLTAVSARAINAAVGPQAKPLEQIRTNYGLMTGGLPTDTQPNIPLESISTPTREGLAVRTTVAERSFAGRAALAGETRLANGEDAWAFQRQTMGLRKRHPSA
ncbi:RHS repeat-associated core domain-containing protein [Pseudomonas putida]